MSTKPYYIAPKRIVVTGGPGAGKRALLEIARRTLCQHVQILPDARAIVWNGGFPRSKEDGPARAAERAIYRVETELESVALANDDLAAVVCLGGTLDVLAYWPGQPDELFRQLGTTEYEELQRYEAVVHLESPLEDRAVDLRLLEVWRRHPRRIEIPAKETFLERMEQALDAIRSAADCHACGSYE